MDSNTLMANALFTLTLLVLSQSGEQPRPASPTPSTLKMQLESYFQIPKVADRFNAVAEIAETHRIQEIVAELTRLELWPNASNLNEWTIVLPSGQSVNVLVKLSLGYKPTEPAPLIIAMSRGSEPVGNAFLKLMGNSESNHILIALNQHVGGSFHQSVLAAGDLTTLLRELRRRIHIDLDHVYLLCEGGGADAAWVAAIMYPNPFAGVIAVSGIPRIPYPEQSYALLLPNLRGTPFLSIWTDDAPGQGPSPVPAANNAIADFALAAGLPFETATLAHNPSGVTPIPERVIASAISRVRKPQSRVDLWFRYLPQGNAGWLRATDLAGDVWTDEQISIAVTAKEDRDAFITETLKQKLFYISGHIDGQSITIETKRIAAIELRLSPEQVDFSKPVTIVVNGRNRFEGLLEPSIKDLLECAYEDWDFQHPVYTRKSFTINAR